MGVITMRDHGVKTFDLWSGCGHREKISRDQKTFDRSRCDYNRK